MRSLLCILIAWVAAIAQPQPARDYPVKPVPFTSVHFNDVFWAPRIEVNRTITIPFAFEKNEETGPGAQLRPRCCRAARRGSRRQTASRLPFDDSDLYKVIEAASLLAERASRPKARCLRGQPDREHRRRAGERRLPLHHAHYRSRAPASVGRPKRWELEKVDSHELYNLGHLYEAAAAHYQATGKRNLLDVALKSAALLDRTFGPGKASIWPGHQITEMGLAKLYRVTGRAALPGTGPFPAGRAQPDSPGRRSPIYNQSYMPVTQQTEAVGHAVRATYMYSGMADVAALTGDMAYVSAIDRIWDNVAGKKFYVTGGIGASSAGEAFGANYELPNMTAYNETCAAIGNDFLESPPVPVARRRALHRRDGAHALQRADLRRLARRQERSSIPTRSNPTASTSAARGSASLAARRTSPVFSPVFPAMSTRSAAAGFTSTSMSEAPPK